MHDLDRIRLIPRAETDISYETDAFDTELISDSEAEELAFELLSAVDSEAELDLFLGKVISQAARRARRVAGSATHGARQFLNSSTGRQLKQVAKGAARKAIEGAGSVLGGAAAKRLGANQSSGRSFGKSAGHALSNWLGLELELMELQDGEIEFEAAKRVVRATAEATRRAMMDTGKAPARAVAKKAMAQGVKKVARKSAAQTVRRNGSASRQNRAARATSPRTTARGLPGGRWVRRGRRIVLYGV